MSKITLVLHNEAQAKVALKQLGFPFIQHWLAAKKKLVLTVSLQKRTPAQNNRYWGKGVLAQIAEQASVNGRMFSADTWHEQFKRQFIGVEELPDGGVRGKSSADLNTAEFCEFCDKAEAFAVTDLGVRFEALEPHYGHQSRAAA